MYVKVKNITNHICIQIMHHLYNNRVSGTNG